MTYVLNQLEAVGLVLNIAGALFMFLGGRARSDRMQIWGMLTFLTGFGMQLLAIVVEPWY